MFRLSANFLAIAVQLVVDQYGNTLEYAVKPLVVRRLPSGKEVMLPGTTCGTQTDLPRKTGVDIVPLETLKNGNLTEQIDYALFNDHLNKVLPK